MTAILVPEHWPAEWLETDLAEYRAGFLTREDGTRWIHDTLRAPEPVGIWCLADGDVTWWCYDHLIEMPTIQRHWLDCLDRMSGMSAEDRARLGDAFEEAARAAPAWLLQYAWDPAERLTFHALECKGAAFSDGRLTYKGHTKRKVDCNSVYRLHNHGLFWPLLEGRKLAVVSCHAGAIARRLMDQMFVAANGGRITWDVAATILSPPPREPKWPHWPRLRDELERSDWDLLLCAAGTLSAIICDHARRIGRKALDIGAFGDVLLGVPHNIARPMLQPGG